MHSVLEQCFISSDVYFSCMSHALTTEVEEIMGLLIGWTDENENVCHITNSVLLKRSDKRKDRVEISPENLASSITTCETLNEERRRHSNVSSRRVSQREGHAESDILPEVRVVGWYHSHPHITVFPSEVDLRTQEQYQDMVHRLWVGLIFGVYDLDEPNKTNRFQYIAFQSVHKNGRLVQHLVPLCISPSSALLLKMPQQPSLLSFLPSQSTLKNVLQAYELLEEEEIEAWRKAREEIDQSDSLAEGQLGCIVYKNMAKIVSMLAKPLKSVLVDLVVSNSNNSNPCNDFHRVLFNGDQYNNNKML